MIAKTPKPPYYAVIFTNLRTEVEDGYAETAARMMQLAAEQDGFLGEESVRNGLGITISYWRDEEAIANWRNNAEHRIAQERGRTAWYAAFKTRVCKVERDYEFQN